MRVFLVGITGSVGTALALLHASRGDQVWGCARSEVTAVRWLAEHPRLATLFLADAYDLDNRLSDAGRALAACDRVYHVAAMKHVNLCEEQPATAVFQNVCVTADLAALCERYSIPMVFVSSDKACLPGGVYGATKLAAERIALRHGAAVARLGNLIGSSGSVFTTWAAAAKNGDWLAVTDPAMTRFFLPISAAAAFLADCVEPGVVVIPSGMRSAVMGEVARQIGATRVTGARPGETLHQWLVAPGERVAEEPGRLVLGRGEVCAEGITSERWPRWNTGELLREAGVAR